MHNTFDELSHYQHIPNALKLIMKPTIREGGKGER